MLWSDPPPKPWKKTMFFFLKLDHYWGTFWKKGSFPPWNVKLSSQGTDTDFKHLNAHSQWRHLTLLMSDVVGSRYIHISHLVCLYKSRANEKIQWGNQKGIKDQILCSRNLAENIRKSFCAIFSYLVHPTWGRGPRLRLRHLWQWYYLSSITLKISTLSNLYQDVSKSDNNDVSVVCLLYLCSCWLGPKQDKSVNML